MLYRQLYDVPYFYVTITDVNLTNFLNKIKAPEGEWFWFVMIALVGLLGFGLGRLSRLEEARPPISIQTETATPIVSALPSSKKPVSVAAVSVVAPSAPAQVSPISAERVYASKTGKRYYYSWCKSRVKEENKVWFGNADQAKAKGLTLGVGCREPF